MPAVRVATFNVENLFARFKFNSDVDPQVAIKDGWDVNRTYFTIFDEASKSLAANTDTVPEIARKGLTTLATRYTGPHFPEVGEKAPVASDHCPVVLDLTL